MRLIGRCAVQYAAGSRRLSAAWPLKACDESASVYDDMPLERWASIPRAEADAVVNAYSHNVPVAVPPRPRKERRPYDMTKRRQQAISEKSYGRTG